jgi:hypothetical protein
LLPESTRLLRRWGAVSRRALRPGGGEPRLHDPAVAGALRHPGGGGVQPSPVGAAGCGVAGFLLDNLLPEKAGKVIATYALQFSQKATNLTIAGAVVLILTRCC